MFSRKINLFEKILLPIGAAVTIFGFYMIVQADVISSTLGWARLAAIFVWLTLVFLMIIAATVVDMKEELALISREHITEVKLLKEIQQDQLIETKNIRKEMEKKK